MSGIIIGQQPAAERATGEGTVTALRSALGVISSACDYAETLDGRGFSAADAWLGHVLAEMPVSLWSDAAALAAWDMLRRYRGQLAAAGVGYAGLPRPDGAGELEAGRQELARQWRDRARGQARQWREQQYRAARSYVRCDGGGQDVVLAFPYDSDLVAACRRISGRRYDSAAKTNVFPFASLPLVVGFADDHGIGVAPEVRALVAAAVGHAGKLAVRAEVHVDEAGRVAISAAFDPALNEALKDLNGGRSTWDSRARVHRPPVRRDPGEVLAIAAEFGLTVADDARAVIGAEADRQERNAAASTALEADPVPVPGLASGMSLKPQQYPVVRFAAEHRRVLIGDDMGWGKTLSSLAAVAADGAYPAVVVCRPSLTLNWVAEIRRFFPGLAVHVATGTTPRPVPPGTDIVVIGSAALAARPRAAKGGGNEFGWVRELAAAAPKALIIDEGQDAKERTANRSQACEQLARSVISRDGLVLDLTGTAILNRPRELCQQLAILGRIGEFGGPQAFLWRYCLSGTSQWGASYNGARNLTELHQRLLAWGIMIRRADDAALGLPPCREHVLRIPGTDLDPGVMAGYRQAEQDLTGFLADRARQAAGQLGRDPRDAAVQAVVRAQAAEHLVAINTLRQLAGQAKRGYVVAWTRDWVAAGEKVMVAAHHRAEVDAYAAEFGGLKLQRGQPVREKEAVKAAFQQQTAAQAPVIAVSIGAGGVGHTLTAARIGIQAEQAWTPGETQQMKKRLHRIGQDRPVDYYITVAEDTIDEHLRAVVTAKQATLDAVLDGRSDEGAADDEKSVVAEVAWRLTEQGLGGAEPAGWGEGGGGPDGAQQSGAAGTCAQCRGTLPGHVAGCPAQVADEPARAAPADDGDDDGHAVSRGQALRDAARLYLSHGLLPVPAWGVTDAGACCCPRGAGCPRPGKHPRSVRTGRGEYSWKPLACATREEVDRRFADGGEYAAANLMLAIPAGMLVIDQDDDDGGIQAMAGLAGQLGELPPTLSHQTPHGVHFIFRTPPGWAGRAWVGKDASNPLPAGIDLRVPGQILMAPPSRVPAVAGLAGYGPAAGHEVAGLPGAYLAAWTPPQARTQAARRVAPVPPGRADAAATYVHARIEGIVADLAGRQPGGRNAAIYTAVLKVGSTLGAARATGGAERAAAGWTDEAAEDALMTAAERNGYAGQHGSAMARSAVRSGLRNGLRSPRPLPDFSAPAVASGRGRSRQGPGGKGQAGVPPAGSAASSPVLYPEPAAALPATSSPESGREPPAVESVAAVLQAAGYPDSDQGRQVAHVAEGYRLRKAPGGGIVVEHDAIADDINGVRAEDRSGEMLAQYAQALRGAGYGVARETPGRLLVRPQPARDHAGAGAAAADPDLAGSALASRAAIAANAAYRAGDFGRARELTSQAAQLDPTRAGLWQKHRAEIDAKSLLVEARAAEAGGDRSQAEGLLQAARQIDPRMEMVWDRNLTPGRDPRRDLPVASRNSGPDIVGERTGQRDARPQWPDKPALRSVAVSQPVRAGEARDVVGAGAGEGRDGGWRAGQPGHQAGQQGSDPAAPSSQPRGAFRQAGVTDWRDAVMQRERQEWQPKVTQPDAAASPAAEAKGLEANR